jgi:hypothetical protein
MNGRSAARKRWYGTMLGVRRAHRGGNHAAEEIVRRLVDHRPGRGVEQRHGDVTAASVWFRSDSVARMPIAV